MRLIEWEVAEDGYEEQISGSRTPSRKLKAFALSMRPSMTFCTCANSTNKWIKQF